MRKIKIEGNNLREVDSNGVGLFLECHRKYSWDSDSNGLCRTNCVCFHIEAEKVITNERTQTSTYMDLAFCQNHCIGEIVE